MTEVQGLLNQAFDSTLRALRVTATDDFWTGDATLVSTDSDSIRVNANGATTAQVDLGLEGPSSQAGLLLGGDTNLYRSAANTLKTDDALHVGGSILAVSGIDFGSSVDVNLYRAGANNLKTDDQFDAALAVFAQSGAAGQVSIGARGPSGQAGILFGSGNDTNLYRSAADTLFTDDDFKTRYRFQARSGQAGQIDIGTSDSDPTITFGSGAGVNLYASGGDTLKTDDALVVAGTLTTNGGLQTFGANDSGGAGFRLVVVPNA